ncbi:MAG: amidohydrolase family protein [Candidatus Heimdallarchaeota archaeon]|nr:amidohydrolase family protein [Candidatus Heimdallarchaeota archaeon]
MTELSLPVGIDIHVHFREPGLEHKETMATGMHAANHGGISAVLEMPNTLPPTDTIEALQYKLKLAQFHPGLNLAAGLTNTSINELDGLMNLTRVFKVFMANSTGNLAISTENLHRGLQILEQGKNLLMVHAENPHWIKERTDNSVENHVRPEISEIEAIKQVLDLSREYKKIHFHVTHVSTIEGAELLVAQDLVSWDVLHKYLDFDSKTVESKGNYAKMNPPLRPMKNVYGLNAMLEEGKIEYIGSDHAPHSRKEKQGLVAGAPGVQELYPFMIDRYLNGRINKQILENMMSNNPRKLFHRFGLKAPEGALVVNTEEVTLVDDDWIKSKCGWSLWSGKTFKGKIIQNSLID